MHRATNNLFFTLYKTLDNYMQLWSIKSYDMFFVPSVSKFISFLEYTERLFRLKGNLLFYFKAPEKVSFHVIEGARTKLSLIFSIEIAGAPKKVCTLSSL